jgi:hypothetical protein
MAQKPDLSQIYASFSMPIRPYPERDWVNSSIHPYLIRNVNPFATKDPTAPKRISPRESLDRAGGSGHFRRDDLL